MASFNHQRLHADLSSNSVESPLDKQHTEDGGPDQSEALTESEAVSQSKDIQTEADDEGYGIGSWRPRVLQRLATPVVFVTLLCFFTTCDAFFSGIQVALLTTLETRYGLSAYQIGMVVTINKIGTMLGLPVAAYIGGRPGTHRPRWLAGSAFVMAIGMVATCIPQFVFGPYQYHHSRLGNTIRGNSSENFDLCSASTNQSSVSPGEECTGNTSSENGAAYVIILISQFVAGVSYAPIRPLGVSYIDDNVKQNSAAFYLGIVSSMYGIGALLGFLASSATSLIWVDFYRTETTLTDTDQAWVSAWWLLFILLAFFLVLSGIPFLGFPKRLPRKWMEEKEKPGADNDLQKVADDCSNDAAPDEGRSSEAFFRTLKLGGVKELLNSLRRICTNGSYVVASFAFVITGLITGLLSFFPKYIESQFGLPSNLVNIFVACVIPALGIGSILGGYLCRRWKLQLIGQTKLCLACVCIAVSLQVFFFAFGCQNPSIAGVHVSYTGNSVDFLPNVTSSCNRHCDCGADAFQPVCWEANQITYVSPCFAGCTYDLDVDGSKQFGNCSCLHDEFSLPDEKDTGSTLGSSAVVQGTCSYPCKTLVPFLLCAVTFVLFFSMEGAPLVLTVVRSVESRDKSFAFGIAKCLQYVIGVIPTPVITGALIDTTCRLWQLDECGAQGACWAHDLPSFRYIMGGYGSLVLLLQVVLLSLCWYFLRRRARYENIVQVKVDGQQPPDKGDVELELANQ